MIERAPILETQDLCKRYTRGGRANDVLRNVNVVIRPGEFVGITGPSGSGKTTFLHLAALLDTPSSGTLRFNGQDLTNGDDNALCEVRKKTIGVVFQQFHLLPYRNAFDNVLFRFRYLSVPRHEARRLAAEALETVGLAGCAAQPARLLSGGEMQRLAIARAVALRPALLLADEPTGNLDRDSARLIMDAFAQLHRSGISILLVTHNDSLLEYTSRQLICNDGRILERAAWTGE